MINIIGGARCQCVAANIVDGLVVKRIQAYASVLSITCAHSLTQSGVLEKLSCDKWLSCSFPASSPIKNCKLKLYFLPESNLETLKSWYLSGAGWMTSNVCPTKDLESTGISVANKASPLHFNAPFMLCNRCLKSSSSSSSSSPPEYIIHEYLLLLLQLLQTSALVTRVQKL